MLTQTAPMMYALLGLNTLGITFTHYGTAPHWLTLPALGLILSVCLWRGVVLWRCRGQVIDAAVARRRLAAARALLIAVGLGVSGWAMLLTRYADAAHQMQVLFFLNVTLVCCCLCLTHLRTVTTIMGVITAPLILYFLSSDELAIRVTALTYVGVSVVMFGMQPICYGAFRRLVLLGAENEALALTDPLTGLPNRRSFFGRLQSAIDRAERQDGPLAIAIIDLDGFKPVNDAFGHLAGDRVLCEVGRRLQAAGCGWPARLGGDEFGLIIDGEPDLDALGRRLCAALQAPYALRDATAQIGASIGFAAFPTAASCAATLVERADYALYHAKALHRGTAIVYAPEHEARLRRHAAVEQALRSADLEREFDLAYQPIIDVAAGRIAAYEALARWTSPILGSVSPAEFIPVAERSGLMPALTLPLFRKALAAMRSWPAEVSLSFNLSAQDLATPQSLARLTEAIAAAGIPPARIIVEVTETALMRDLPAGRRALLDLKRLGLTVALDDFGTGHSSLSYVHQLPIDRLKIDRSFVADICGNPTSVNIVRSIIDLCRNLKMQCITEGVETREQMLLLHVIGCRAMQGYLFLRPQPESALTQAAAVALSPLSSLREAAPAV
ncbi:putative bifunctional diguanylate cyclase/phosphodiesterase [Methylobacterium sp. ID0610]|uniref:putative bifunctional diguanylate cyclase/phosphodiesterase n=1 Tax=Methylobacterium carpenticola TaxID=3344827 RepID=UPI003676251F